MTAVIGYLETFDEETLLFTPREVQAFLRLQISYVRQGAPLPDDDARLAIAAGVSRRSWGRMRPLFATFFAVDGGVWRHARLDRQLEARAASRAELQAAEGKRAKISEARRYAAHVRWCRVQDCALCKRSDLHMQNRAGADASASPRLETTGRQALALASAKGQSQSLPSSNANEDARASAFASKGRARKDERPPEMRLPLVQVHEGGLQRAPPSFADVWSRVTAQLRRELGDMRFSYWIAPLEVVSAEGGKVVIDCRSRFERDKVATDFGERIANLIVHAAPAFMAVDFIVSPRPPPKENVA